MRLSELMRSFDPEEELVRDYKSLEFRALQLQEANEMLAAARIERDDARIDRDAAREEVENLKEELADALLAKSEAISVRDAAWKNATAANARAEKAEIQLNCTRVAKSSAIAECYRLTAEVQKLKEIICKQEIKNIDDAQPAAREPWRPAYSTDAVCIDQLQRRVEALEGQKGGA